MPAHNSYFPSPIGKQNVWLHNWRDKIGEYEATLGYAAPEIAATKADAAAAIYALETLTPQSKSFAQSVTVYVKTLLYGPGPGAPNWPVLVFGGPAPALVAPGALKRIFAFVANLKTRTAYNEGIGENLGIIGVESEEDPDAVPVCAAEARDGEVRVTFKKAGHMGVWIEGQRGAETTWTFVGIDTSNPYNDARPLAAPGVPEKRRYRLCFWDGEPTKIFSPVIEATFGG